MPGRSPKSVLLGAATGALVVSAATMAHVAAGGRVDVFALLGLVALVTALGATLAARVQPTFGRAVAGTLMLQPVVHEMLGDRSPMASHPADGVDHVMTPTAMAADDVSTMAVAHATVALACAVAVRWCLRWLRSMPAVARALVVPCRGAVTPIAVTAVGIPVCALWGPVARAVVVSWDTRGPPR